MAVDSLTRIRVPFQVKGLDEDARTFSGYASTFDLDLGDDVIHPGAFTKTLREWKRSNQAMPLLNSHEYWDIMSALGQMVEAREDDDGLWSKWEVIDGPDGDRVMDRLRPSKRTGRAAVGAMSIGYLPTRYDYEDNAKAATGQIRNIHELKLSEVSLVLFPMNPAALIDVASVKMVAGDLSAEARSALHLQLKAAEAALTLSDSGESAASDGLVDPPDFTTLDQLRVRQLRLMA